MRGLVVCPCGKWHRVSVAVSGKPRYRHFRCGLVMRREAQYFEFTFNRREVSIPELGTSKETLFIVAVVK